MVTNVTMEEANGGCQIKEDDNVTAACNVTVQITVPVKVSHLYRVLGLYVVSGRLIMISTSDQLKAGIRPGYSDHLILIRLS